MSAIKVFGRLSLQILFVLPLSFLFLVFVMSILITFVLYLSWYEVLLFCQYVLLAHPILLGGRLDLASDGILKTEGLWLALEPVVVKIYVGLLLELVGCIVNVELLNTIFDFQEHGVVFQFGVGRQALVQYLLLKLHVFRQFVLVSIGVQLETKMLLFTMSFRSSIIEALHLFLRVLHFWMLASINAR